MHGVSAFTAVLIRDLMCGRTGPDGHEWKALQPCVQPFAECDQDPVVRVIEQSSSYYYPQDVVLIWGFRTDSLF
jgi:hypothetical protein